MLSSRHPSMLPSNTIVDHRPQTHANYAKMHLHTRRPRDKRSTDLLSRRNESSTWHGLLWHCDEIAIGPCSAFLEDIYYHQAHASISEQESGHH